MGQNIEEKEVVVSGEIENAVSNDVDRAEFETDVALTSSSGEVILYLQKDLIPELSHLNEEEKKGFGSWTLLLITIFLFFSAGVIRMNPTEIFILILVLFIHEFGHMVAMNLLKYSDVKMFFIPLLGAENQYHCPKVEDSGGLCGVI